MSESNLKRKLEVMDDIEVMDDNTDNSKKIKLEHKCTDDIKIIAPDGYLNVCKCKIEISPILSYIISLVNEIVLNNTNIQAVKNLFTLHYAYNCHKLSDILDVYDLAYRYEFKGVMSSIEWYKTFYNITSNDIIKIWNNNFNNLKLLIKNKISEIKDFNKLPSNICKELIDHTKSFISFIECFKRCDSFTDEELKSFASKHSPCRKEFEKDCNCNGAFCDRHSKTIIHGMELSDPKLLPYDNIYFAKYLAYRLQIEIEDNKPIYTSACNKKNGYKSYF